jgi:hypothetical protein
MATLKRVRLELARDRAHPAGSSDYGYEIAAPLSDDGHLDAALWKAQRARCRVRRFWKGERDEIGHLVHRGSGWAIDYDPTKRDDDERGFKFGAHRFVPGEYVSITEHDGVMRTFHVRSVVDLD